MEEVKVVSNDEEEIVVEKSFLKRINLDFDTNYSKIISTLWLISFTFFSLFLIKGWSSIFYLYKHNFFFTFYRYTSYPPSIISYFPIQLHPKFFCPLLIYFLIICSLTYFYYIKKALYDNDKVFFTKMFTEEKKYHLIPILMNIGLLEIGQLTCSNIINFFHIYFYLGLCFDSFSLYYLIFLLKETDFGEDDKFSNLLIKDFFFINLFCLDSYYLIYVICQILSYFLFKMIFIIILGIIANFFLGGMCLYFYWKFKNLFIGIFYLVVFSGLITFHYMIPLDKRKEFGLYCFDVILSSVFIVLILVEIFFIHLVPNNSINKISTSS